MSKHIHRFDRFSGTTTPHCECGLSLDDHHGTRHARCVEALRRCIDKLSEVRNGTDFEAQCWDAADSGRAALAEDDAQ